MSNFQEFEEKTGPKTNYKKWAFKFLIYTVIINVFVFFMVYRGNHRPLSIIVFSWIANLILLAGTIFTILSVQNKEPRNYQYYASIIGYSILIILTIMSILGTFVNSV